MAKEFPLESIKLNTIETKYRKISEDFPVHEVIEKLKMLRIYEPQSMRGQPPIIWDRAEGINVFDKYGNKWLDFSSGVLITNAGHGNPKIAKAIIELASKPLLTSYCFPNQPRIDLVRKLISHCPKELNKVFLLSTGSEGVECALKLMRTYGRKIGGDSKSIIVSFNESFHGRTLGAQQLGALGTGKNWIKNYDSEIVHVPFPDGFHNEDTSFNLFVRSLEKLSIQPENVAGVISETYQGAGPNFMPVSYAQDLRKWCNKYKAVLCFDEVQAGFGRCGKFWGFELYGIIPDLFCLGKGFSSSLPISGVVGRTDIMDLYGPNEMTSTHSGNPLCCAAALANIEVIECEKLVENAAKVGKVLQQKIQEIQKEFSEFIGFASCQGLVGGLLMVKKGTKSPFYEMAWDIVNLCFQKGLLLFAPVGVGGGCVKIAPPLCINEEAVIEGCSVIYDSIKELISKV